MTLSNLHPVLACCRNEWELSSDLVDGLPDGGLNLAHELTDRHVQAGRGDQLALLCLGHRYERNRVSFAQLADRSARLAAFLRLQGVQPGDVVAVMLGREESLYVAALAAWRIGAVYCPLYAALGPGLVKARLELAQARVLVTDRSVYARKIRALRAGLPCLNLVLLVPGENPQEELPSDCQDLPSVLRDTEAGPLQATGPGDAAFLHFTSGTTGTPKGIIHSHGSILAQIRSARQVFHLEPKDVFWCTADPGWVTSTVYGIIAPLAIGCVSLVDADDVDPRRWYGLLKEEGVNVWYTTPTNIRLMMRFGAALARIYRENSLRIAASCGEPLSADAVAWGGEALGAQFLDSWWQTETGSIAIANRPGHNRPGSMGQPLPGVEAAIMRRDLSRLVPVEQPEEVGELAIRADLSSMFTAYLGRPGLCDACFQDGWYLTGDLVRRDADGYFWFVGRSDDMIHSAGHHIGPFEIESLMLTHPAVAEAGVVGRPDSLLTEVPIAFVSLNPGFEEGSSLRRELLAFARQELGAAMAPRDVEFVVAMPKTSTGKILRRALKSHAESIHMDGEEFLPGSFGRDGD